ncbi:RabGAP/TBC [Lichtheimia hyalospora FSU 10163]|nr:RabGAP/TBC [Lichtheimia hyalospora FSU 10163]
MDGYAPTRRAFWKKPGRKNKEKIPADPQTTISSPKIVGAHYSYTCPSGVMLPSQYSSRSASPSSSSSSKPTKTKSSSTPAHSHQHSYSSLSPLKSFDAFIKDTNDEWSDDLGYDLVNRSTQLSCSSSSSIRHPLSESSSSPLSHQSLPIQPSSPPSFPPITEEQPTPTYKGTLKTDIDDLLIDPTNIIHHIDTTKANDLRKIQKFIQALSDANVDLAELRKLSWSGIPKDLRLVVWQLLFGYLPCNQARRAETLARKRKEYTDSVAASYSRGTAGLDQTLWHQIRIDIPRTNPGAPLYQYKTTQDCLERILYQWAIRHPATGYVQGINDLVTPIFEVFLGAYIDVEPQQYDMDQMNQEVLSIIEADSFWCLSKLLDGIQDNYTFAQPGIQRQIAVLKELVSRIESQLASHLMQEGIEFMQFAFRWMNCLLMREVPMQCTVRMWDTYLAEGSSDGFSEFHVYVCAAFLAKWSKQLLKLDFQGTMVFLQQLPTQAWQEKDVELLLSEAYMWKTLFHNAPRHLKK